MEHVFFLVQLCKHALFTIFMKSWYCI